MPSNLTQRILTAVVLLPFVLIAAVLGGWPFTILAGALACVGVAEFYMMASQRMVQGSVLIGVPMSACVMLAFHFGENTLWIGAFVVGSVLTFILETARHPRDLQRSLLQVGMTLLGVLYVAVPTGFVIGLRALPDGVVWLLLVFALTWGTDSFAYIGGRLWGRNMLAPTISPKKTVEGAIVGVLGGIVPSIIILVVGGKFSLVLLILVVSGPFVAIFGDLLESWLKRTFGVKDSHIEGLNVLPGHGGVLDRVDALIAVAAVCYIFLHLVVF